MGTMVGSLILHRLTVPTHQGEGMGILQVSSQIAASDGSFGGFGGYHGRKQVAAMERGEGEPGVRVAA